MKKILLNLAVLLAVVCSTEKITAQCTASIVNSSGTVLCQSDTTWLFAMPQGQPLYQWSVNGTPIGGNTEYLEQIISTPGTYVFTVDITDANNCVATSSPVSITVSPAPSGVTITNNGPVCAGGTLQFTATGTNVNNWQWYGPGGFSSTLQDPGITNVTSANNGWYSLYASTGGCTVMQTVMGSVIGGVPQMDVEVYGTCVGDTVIVASGAMNINNAVFSWTGPNGFTSNQSDLYFPNAQPNIAGTYSLTVTGTDCNGNPITFTDAATVTVDAVPVVTASTSTPQICVGNTIQLSGTVTGGSGATWSGPANFTSVSMTPAIPNAQVVNGGIYTLTATNGGCTASDDVVVNVSGPSLTVYAGGGPICEGDSLFLYAEAYGFSTVTFSWTGPNSFTSTQQDPLFFPAQISNSGLYTVTATGTATCGGTVTLTSSGNALVLACDSVWPGDANSDFYAGYLDVLEIGVLNGLTGAARPGATNNWVAQYCPDWGNVLGVDNKHADCNGDGVIDNTDVNVINLNYGMSHNKGVHVPQAKSAAFPDLYFDMTGIALGAGGTFTIPIKLGTSALPMNNVYGIGAQIKVQGITPASAMVVDGSTSWLNNTNAIDFEMSVSNGQTDWAYVRTNHTHVSGDGTIGSLTFTVPAGTEYQSACIFFENVKIIDQDGVELTDYNVLDACGLVFPLSLGNTEVVNSVSIVPNPSDAQAELQLTLSADKKIQVVVTDITGRNIWSANHNGVKGAQSISLPAAHLASGMYTIQVRDEQGAISQTMKWIKK